MSQSWTCPFCARAQIITNPQFDIIGRAFVLERQRFGHIGFEVTAIACANPECGEVELSCEFLSLNQPAPVVNQWARIEKEFKARVIEAQKFRPKSQSKVQPEFIPLPLREDYYEACAIRNASPKSAATLARRCLQGMIRDFCGISKGTLGGEIEALRKRLEEGAAPRGVTEESVDAIDAVRSIGSIGAHMERDINIIVDVDPGEAQALIELIELLFEEWYTAQHQRAAKLARVNAIAAEKKAELAEAKMKLIAPPT
ncbi:DUF4145 domain-containing protein [Methylobacterium brachiatum]|uniref:DUF4145 domain-containing protein n=1 Tax=Methylobacterium brachiatum TaxID=269660 RepID=A0ABV1RAK2_9HYPH